jgi:hypothetical protein
MSEGLVRRMERTHSYHGVLPAVQQLAQRMSFIQGLLCHHCDQDMCRKGSTVEHRPGPCSQTVQGCGAREIRRVNACLLVNTFYAFDFPFQDQPFCSSAEEMVTVKDTKCWDVEERVLRSCYRLEAIEEVRLGEVGNLLEANNVVEI